MTANFSFLKNTARYDELIVKSIPIDDGTENIGLLVPICKLNIADKELLKQIADWRKNDLDALPSRINASIEDISTWLRVHFLEADDRILFVILNKHGRPSGCLGFSNALQRGHEMEISDLARGDNPDSPALVGNALKKAIEWARQTTNSDTISLHVSADNEQAITFYESLGFTKPSGSNKQALIKMVHLPEPIIEAPKQMITTAGPSISSKELAYVFDATRNGWYENCSNYLAKFEEQFAHYLGIKHALTTSSCTGALHLALAGLGIGPGDEVIVPDITWVATANAVTYVGATPVFCDVDLKTWCIDPIAIENAISERTKAIVPVHLYGHPAPMHQVMQIARRYNLFVVEDAAASLGSEILGRKTGTFGDVACFSFQGTKLMTTGEGGMLVTDDDALFARIHKIWDQGRDPRRTFWIDYPGLKYKMSNLQAALGLAQLERIDELIAAKRKIFSWYEENLKDVKEVRLHTEPEGSRSNYWMSSLSLTEASGLDRDQFMSALRKFGVDPRPVFPAISQYPIWSREQSPQPNALKISANSLYLPSKVSLKRSEADYVCNVIREIVHANP